MEIPDRVFDELVRQGKEEERREKEKICLERLTMYGVLFYGAVAFVTWIVLLYSNAATQLAAEAAKASSDAAIKSADAEVAASRAWILPTGATVTVRPNVISPEVDFGWVNAGKVPAFNLRIREQGKVRASFVFPKGCPTTDPLIPYPYLVPGQPLKITSPAVPSTWVGGFDQELVIHGCITYRDVLTDRTCDTEYYYAVDRMDDGTGTRKYSIEPWEEPDPATGAVRNFVEFHCDDDKKQGESDYIYQPTK